MTVLNLTPPGGVQSCPPVAGAGPALAAASAWATGGALTLTALVARPDHGPATTVLAAVWASAATWWLARRSHARRLAEAVAAAARSAEQAHLALHDDLTGLPRRPLLLDRLEHALAAADRSRRRVGVVFLDVDGLKQVNDAHGHAAGDALLVAVADRLRRVVRASDTAGRLGGDEFVVLCEGLSDEADLAAAVQRIRAALDDSVDVAGHPRPLSVSVGGALHAHGTGPELLHRADAQMYASKRSRRAAQGVRPTAVPAPRAGDVADLPAVG